MTSHRATIITDLGYGDAGKGSTVDFLSRTDSVGAVVRFNGGPQAGHNVVTADGRHHMFAQFGSGSLAGAVTHLSRFMLTNPLTLSVEAEKLAQIGIPNALSLVTIDEQATVISPYQQSANRLREIARGDGRHGSCGYGVGETMADCLEHPDEILVAADMGNRATASRKLAFLRDFKFAQLQQIITGLPQTPEVLRELETFQDPELIEAVLDFYADFVARTKIVGGEYLGELLNAHEHVVFEGAQGVLLDEWWGFHPYTTWSTITNANADRLLAEAGFDDQVTRLGLLRGFATRHGAGPFVTENAELTARLGDFYNPYNPWQKEFRVGHFDAVSARYALEITGNIDGLVISNLDRMAGLPDPQICLAYNYHGSESKRPAALPHRRVSRIVPSPKIDLDYQEVLTTALFDCSPVLTTAISGEFGPNQYEDYLAQLESALSLPVVLTSAGPTAQDKRRR